MTFKVDPEERHQFPDRLFRRELQVPANLRELIEDLDGELAARLDFDLVQLWRREHIFEDWRHFERDLPFLVPYRAEPNQHVLLCLLLDRQSQADRLMPLRMLVNGSMFWESEWKAWEGSRPRPGPLALTPIVPVVFHTGLTRWIRNRTPAELVRGPGELRQLAPQWPIFQPDPTSQEEVQNMSTTLGQTLEEWAEQRGIERG